MRRLKLPIKSGHEGWYIATAGIHNKKYLIEDGTLNWSCALGWWDTEDEALQARSRWIELQAT